MRIKVEAVDPGTLQAIRDITAVVEASSSNVIEQDISSDIVYSGKIGYAGNATWIAGLVRVSAEHDDGSTDVLGTFFATPDAGTHKGNLYLGEVQLDGVLLGLKSARTTSTYVAGRGTNAIDVIRDACAQAGRATSIDSDLAAGRYAETIIYEAGTDWLTICLEAAERSGMRLTQDRMGYVSVEPIAANRGQRQVWNVAPGATDIVSEISRTDATYSSATRVIATYGDAENTIAATAEAERGPYDAQTSGRRRDVSISVSDMIVPSIAELTSRAQQELDKQLGSDEWSFDCLYRIANAGDAATIYDATEHTQLDGIVSHTSISLDGLLSMSVSVQGRAQ